MLLEPGLPEPIKCGRSTNGGASWTALQNWIGTVADGYRDVDLVVTQGYAFVAYIYANQVRVRRHSSITGFADSVRTVFTGTATDSCYDVAITSDVDEYPTAWWLYVTALIGSTVYAKRSTTLGLTWTNYATIGTNAIGRVDIAYAPFSTNTELFVAYHRNNDSLYVVRNIDYGDSLDWLTPQNTGVSRKNSSANAWPSVAAMADTAIIVYEYNYGPSDNDVHYVISTNDGSTWTQGTVFSATTNEDYPNITGRSGAGWAVVCVYDVGSTCNIRFRQSTRYSSPSFTNTADIADSIARFNVGPAIEYYDLPSPRYGIVYVSFRPYEWAWFDYNNVGIVEEVANNQTFSKTIAINCFPNPSVSPKIELEILKPSTVSLKIYDINGNIVRNLINKNLNAGKTVVVWDGKDDNGTKVAQGIYFVKLSTESKSAMTKVIKLQ
ncbi:MAG: T9SS type A sorting domain-containing protein [candidate division WOR-3 bacterium]